MQNERTNVEIPEQGNATPGEDQPTGYNESQGGRTDGGETNEQQPGWRPGDDPAGVGENNPFGQGEDEPGRSKMDRTGDEDDILSSRGHHPGQGGF
jgi:hypothetical protein